MQPAMLASFLFVLLLTVITVYGYRAYVRPSRIYDRVGGVAETVRTPGASPRQRIANVFEQIGDKQVVFCDQDFEHRAVLRAP